MIDFINFFILLQYRRFKKGKLKDKLYIDIGKYQLSLRWIREVSIWFYMVEIIKQHIEEIVFDIQ